MAATLGVNPSDVQGLQDMFGNGCRKHFPDCHPGAQNAALGGGPLTAVDQANTFATLVSGGISATPHIISYLVQANGLKVPAHVVKRQAVTPEVAGDTDWALSFDTSTDPPGGGAGAVGTGVPNAVWDRPMIAKTGTLGQENVATEAWFIGAIPQYSLSVGMFTDKPNANPPEILDGLPTIGGWTGGYGGAWPAHIWHTFMSEEFSNLAIKQLPPEGFSGNDPVFTKWIQALPPKKKKKKCQTTPGAGHHHHHWPFVVLGNGGTNCPPGGSPSPSPSQSSSPSPSSTPTPTTSSSPSPTPSGSPSPSQTPPFANPQAPNPQVPHPHVPSPAGDTAELSAVAILPTELPKLIGRAVTSGLA